MEEMACVSWISVCVLVVSAAIPLTERRGFLEINNVTLTKNESIDTTQTNKSRDDVSGNKSIMSSANERGKCNTTKPRQVKLKGEIKDFISGSHNITRRLHSGMKRIYRTYKQGTASVHSSNLIHSVSAYLGPFIPSLAHPNTTFQDMEANNSLKFLQASLENTNQAYIDNYIALNTSDYLDHLKQTKKQMSQKGFIKDKVDVDNATSSTEGINTTFYSKTKDSTEMSEQVTVEQSLTCQHVPGFNKLRWLKMIEVCPKNWTEHETKLRCELWQDLNSATIMDDLTFLPVQDGNGTVYANVYCAKCHEATYLLPWISRFDCNKTSQKSFEIPDFTDLDFLYTNLLTSTCQREIIPSIPQTLEECEAEIQPYTGARKLVNDEADVMTASYPVSFTVIMNFDFTGNTHILFTANQKIVEEEYTTKCQVGETFDPFTSSCRQLTCNSDYTLVGNDCIPNGDTSTSLDDITNLSQLRTVDTVTLQLNITFGDFLLLRYQDIEPGIAPQIAGYLNISVDRLRDVNITYELGSINGSALQMTPLTEEEYRSMIQKHPAYNASSHNDLRLDWKSPAKPPKMSNISGSPPVKQEKEKSQGMHKKEMFAARKNATARETATGVKPTPLELKASTGRHKFDTRVPSNSTFQKVQGVSDKQELPQTASGNVKKTHSTSKYNFEIVSALLANSSRHNLPGNTKWFQHPFKYRGKQVCTQYANFFRFHFKYPDNDTDLYVSAPVNEENERVSLLIPDSLSLQLLLDQNMVMRISFFLVPPDDRQSNEEESRDLLRKMDNLIYEQQFSLKLNGNDVEVVAVDDLAKNNEEMTFCPLGVEYLVYDDEFMILNENNITMMFVNKTNSYVGVGMFDLFLVVSGSNEAGQTNFTDMTQYAFVCFMPRISEHNCDMIDLSRREYRIVGDNKSIIFEGKEYDIFQYRIVDEKTGSVQICVPPTFGTHNMTLRSYVTTIGSSCSSYFDAFLIAEGYMTLVLGRVSIAALACVIFTYLLFKSLRNLPGLNLMNLTFALLVTQIIFAGGIEENRSYLCTAVAVSLHYTLLAAHFWMNVMSYDVYKTFTNPVILTRARETRKYLYRYALYAWGVPLIIVSFCMFIDFSHLFSGVSIGYGAAPAVSSSNVSFIDDNSTSTQEFATNSNNTLVAGEQTIHTCWITKPLAALVAFGAVILVIFLVNCIFFGKTISSISKTAKITKKSLGTRHSNSSSNKINDTSEVKLYVRMSTVMGFTWIFGLSSSILSSFVTLPSYIACAVVHAFSILFIIFNTSQGFFIFVAFVCNRRVLGLYKELFHKFKLLIGQRRRSSLFSVSSILPSSHNNRQSR